ncbi:molybdenum cofactor guanylyltransferase [Candidatus Mycobacterium methanotrophicum]|uniref:Probable molybdenum cofactor guanylyltransferase n=1 Tax=Candidatus Mycobacterium methanotrophicum TaxID=2943498 RepID=A0ABY4QRY2_9MYCO|nr:molybdenum cofactor guanylyltransferase [Candidatus Mycobacterium methanotrophicum]UQX12690.1 molybdenum cofactor guanylyltransferase [Candidatus Mycobacterium methanotrophicum]
MTPTAEPASLAGVVLAGGASLRTGRDKAIMPVPAELLGSQDGAEPPITMVERVVSVVGERCQPVFVVAAPGQRLPSLPARVVRDDVRGLGPLLAAGRGLRTAAEAGAKRAFLCAADMPWLSADLIDLLDERAVELNADVVLPWDGRDHYLAAVYRTELAAQVDALIADGERNMRSLVDRVDAQRIVLPESRSLANVNSVADMRRLLRAGR